MRRGAIPPLCGGAVQALPNIHTTLRDHPHPASRPMTFGHFTSWRADDRGYYTGVEYTPTEVGHFFGARMCPVFISEVQETCQTDHARAAVRACGPRGIFCKGFVPSAHDRSIAGAPRGEMKSVDLPEFIRNLWFLYDFSMSARTRILKIFR